ncbi:MAG: archaellin/type IV pilin N-terminal domain-containing protein [Candidatus Bathyarchaeia archaeon]
MRRSFRRSIKAVSPVIATIIIVAVAIVMSIAVAYWMLGLATTFTRYEKLEYTEAYAIPQTGGSWKINLKVKNTGSATATINQILINGIPYKDIKVDASSVDVSPDVATNPKSVNPGKEESITVTLPQGSYSAGKFTSGVTIEITIQTAAGNQYPKTIVLP